MRNVAICGDNVQSIISEPSFVTAFKMEGIPINCGLIHTESSIFNPDDDKNATKVLVKIRAFSCNYRDKSLILSTATQAPPNRFNTVGSDFVGEVVAIGSAVTSLQVGDRVIGNNAYPDAGAEGEMPGIPTNYGSKEYRIFHPVKLAKIPAQMPDEVAAAFSIGAQTIYSMIRKLQIKPGSNVLVTAAKSNTSLFAIQVLQQYDVNVYASSRSLQFEQQLLDMGVKKLIPIQPEAQQWIDPDLAQELKQETNGFDCIIDPFFDVHIGKLLPSLKVGGRYITCGLYEQYSELTNQPFTYQGLSLKDLLLNAMLNNLQIIGNCLGLKEDIEAAIADYGAGKFDVLIDSVFSGNQIAEFFDRTYNSPDRLGKVVYRYD